jgi:hypothetical protein
MYEMESCLPAAIRLHEYLVNVHWHDNGLFGPDPGIRLNYRIGRFIKSYLHGLPWKDDLYYLQGQGYWVLGNWELFERTGESAYRQLALDSCHSIVASQCSDGAWMYPNREWKGRVATVEGIWASIALLETCRRARDDRLLEAALRWHSYLVNTIGFQRFGDELAINYFAHRAGAPPTPNNSAEALRFFSTLASVTGDQRYLQPCAGLATFLRRTQKPSGEFPYLAATTASAQHPRPHFQCCQYNAFMCLGIMRYHELTGDPVVQPVIAKLLKFIAEGVGRAGAVSYECGVNYRHVTYHAGVVAAAFAHAEHLGFSGYDQHANRVFEYVLGRQRPDGSFLYSTGDYRILSDRRSYPRYLAMIMYHLLHVGMQRSQAASRIEHDGSTA